MGAKLSCTRGLISAVPSDRSGSGSGSLTGADLLSYEAACRADPHLRSFDSALQARTSRAISSIAVDVRSLSLESLSQVTECLLEMNQEVVRIILQNKRDSWKNNDLSDLVDDYFQNSHVTLDFCASLDACLARAGHIESIVNVAIRKFQEEHACQDSARNQSSTLEELRNFKSAGDPFTEDFFRVFTSVHSHQLLMLQRLQAQKRKLDKKLNKMKAWRRASNVIFVAAFASVLIFSVVVAAVTASPVMIMLPAAAAVPLAMGSWLNSVRKKCERDLRGQREIISPMQIGSLIVISDLDNIRVLVDRFRIEIEALLGNADFAMREEEAVVVAVEEIKKKVGSFIRMISDLSAQANKCTQEMRMARTLVLRKIINYPSGSSGHD